MVIQCNMYRLNIHKIKYLMVSYLICVAVGILPSYINSALTDTTGSIPRLATAKTLSPLNIKYNNYYY